MQADPDLKALATDFVFRDVTKDSLSRDVGSESPPLDGRCHAGVRRLVSEPCCEAPVCDPRASFIVLGLAWRRWHRKNRGRVPILLHARRSAGAADGRDVVYLELVERIGVQRQADALCSAGIFVLGGTVLRAAYGAADGGEKSHRCPDERDCGAWEGMFHHDCQSGDGEE
jgi:hypothetical protein